VKDVILIRIIV